MNIIAEDDGNSVKKSYYLRNLKADLLATFTEYGAEECIRKQRGVMAVSLDKIACDYYNNHRIKAKLNGLSPTIHTDNKPSISTLESICHGFGISMLQFFSIEGSSVVLTEEQLLICNGTDIEIYNVALFHKRETWSCVHVGYIHVDFSFFDSSFCL